MQLVIHPPVEEARLTRIVAAAGAMRVVNAADESAALAAMPRADAFFGKLIPELLAAATKLRWVQSPTASLEHYLFPALVEHPCVLTNMRGLYSDVIAEHVLGLMLCFTRHLHTYIRNQSAHRWAPVGGEETRPTFATGPGALTEMDRAHRSLGDLTLGLVGLGHIGSEIARRSDSFGMRVLAIDPVQTRPTAGVAALWPVERLDDLLGESDFVVVAAPHTPQTERLFGRRQFQKMKRDAVLINIGRGAIVVLDDLVAALQAGEIAGAALDVFETEPLPAVHPLWSLENVILTPHVAGQSPRIAERHLGVLLENIGQFVRGEALANVVDKRRWF
ncbi:MAG: D-2-hydroxyacid dehydrogenase [Pirellulales bacterium]